MVTITQSDGSLTVEAWQEIETVVSYLKLLGIREPVSLVFYCIVGLCYMHMYIEHACITVVSHKAKKK